MPSKRVETIDRLPHEGKDIVHSSRKLETRVHHRNGYWLGNPAKSPESHRGCGNHNLRGHVRRSEELVPLSGLAVQGRGSKRNIPGASFPIVRVHCNG